MHPDLISIGFLHVKTYGCCMALGFFMAWHVLSYLCKRIGRSFDPLGNLVISLMVSGVVGSRIAYVIEHWQSEFAANPMSVIRVDQGGLMFYGGFILAAAVFMGWCFFKKEKPLALAFVEEYGERRGGASTLAYIKEHGRCIVAGDAVERLAPLAV